MQVYYTRYRVDYTRSASTILGKKVLPRNQQPTAPVINSFSFRRSTIRNQLPTTQDIQKHDTHEHNAAGSKEAHARLVSSSSRPHGRISIAPDTSYLVTSHIYMYEVYTYI